MHGHIPCPTEKKTKTGIVGTVFKVRLPSAIEVPIEPRPTPRFFYYFCDNSRDPMENETTFLLTRYSLRETTVSNKGRCIFETETKESTTGFGTTVTIKRYSFGASWFCYCTVAFNRLSAYVVLGIIIIVRKFDRLHRLDRTCEDPVDRFNSRHAIQGHIQWETYYFRSQELLREEVSHAVRAFVFEPEHSHRILDLFYSVRREPTFWWKPAQRSL